MAYKIKGKWTLTSSEIPEQIINFYAPNMLNNLYTKMGPGCYYVQDNTYFFFDYIDQWQEVDFTDEWQPISKEFYDWMLIHAVSNGGEISDGSLIINITSPKGITLATEKTIVNSNIKVTIDESLLSNNTSDATATADEILAGEIAYTADGKVTGSMPNNGTISKTMDGINTKSVTIPTGYTSGGSVSLDNTIDNEVDEQADLIEQIKNVVNNLPEASGGDSHKYILHGTYTLSSNPTYDGSSLLEPIEITFEDEAATSYFPDGDYMGSALMSKLYIDRDKIEIQSAENLYGINGYDVTTGVWYNSNTVLKNESYRIINICKPIEISKNVYELFMTLLNTDVNTYQPYEVGYQAGYSDCESEMGDISGENILGQFGIWHMFVMSEAGLVWINGSSENVVPISQDGVINFMIPCSAEEFSSTIYMYAVSWIDIDSGEYEVIGELNPTYTEITNSRLGTMVSGVIPFNYETPRNGILITTEPIEMEV